MTRVTASEHRDRPERRTLWSRRRLLATAVLAGVGAAFESAGSTSERHRVRQKFGGYPMGVHGASLRAFPNEELAEIVAVDLELHWLELTAAQIRLEDVERGRDAGPAASLQEVRKLRELLESSDITPTAFGLVRFAGDKESNGCNSHTDTAGSLPTAYRHDIVESRNLRLVGMCEQGPGSLEAIALHESSEG